MERKPLDLGVLQAIFEGDAAGVSAFLIDLSGTVDRVETKIIEALAREDWSGARRAVHEMKGMCASSGCTEVAELCLGAEVPLDAGRYTQMPDYVASLRSACGRLRTAISNAA